RIVLVDRAAEAIRIELPGAAQVIHAQHDGGYLHRHCDLPCVPAFESHPYDGARRCSVTACPGVSMRPHVRIEVWQVRAPGSQLPATTWWMSRSWSLPITRCIPIRANHPSGCPSVPRGTGGPR